jgi:hypothetical protein
MRTIEVTTDRTLCLEEGGDPDGAPVVYHMAHRARG